MSAPTRPATVAELWDLVVVVAEALDIPHAATVGGDQARAEVLDERVCHTKLALRRVLDGTPASDLVWETGYLRERLAEAAPVGYVTDDEAHAALAAGRTWTEATDPGDEARWWRFYDLHGESGPVDAARRVILPLVAEARAPQPPKGLRGHLRRTLPPDVDVDPTDDCERWLGRWLLTLGELDREQLAKVNRELGKRDDGLPAKGEIANRRRRTAKACIRRAVEFERLSVDPWPPTPKGRARRKINRVDVAVETKRLHAPGIVVRVLDCMVNHQPASRTYQAMTAVVFYAGMRPSEVKMLRPEALHLPHESWGWIAVDQTDDGEDNPAEPKTGRRRVPIPPRLVHLLRDWIAERNLQSGQLLFRTRHGNPQSESNWCRALKGAHKRANVHHIAVYDYRHAAATSWIRCGMPLAEAAQRLGDSVETLVSYYIDAMEGDENEGNAAVEKALAGTRDLIVAPEEPTSRV